MANITETDKDTREHYYRIVLHGYGVELVYSASSQKEYDYWNSDQARQDLGQFDDDETNALDYYLFENDNSDTQFQNVPHEFRRNSGWYDQDELAHTTGVNYNSAYITVEEFSGPTPDYSEIDVIVEDKELPEFIDICCNTVDTEVFEVAYDYVFYAMSIEKGVFFDGMITTIGPIDLCKLSFYTTEYLTDDNIIHTVTYDYEEIDNEGSQTSGKSMHIEIIEV